MAQKKKRTKDTRSFWDKAHEAVRFEKNGLVGLKSPTGKIVLKPEYDQIEFCEDYIYALHGEFYTLFYPNDGMSDCYKSDDDYRFCQNGKIGLRNADGTDFLPAVYDEIFDWGENCDVIYVRAGKEFHYYTHALEEILTEYEHIKEDRNPQCPYYLDEDQNRRVLVCVEPIEKKEESRDCYAFNQWVRLSRIPYKDVGKMFANCKVLGIPKDAINRFNDKSTYIYSARTCTANGDYPITACIEKLKTLDCYTSSWYYLFKISVNERTRANPHDLYNAIRHFEDSKETEECDDYCIDYHITIKGPVRAGADIQLNTIFEDYPNPNRPVDFIIKDKKENVLAIGLARYDGDRGGAQEDDRTGGYSNCAKEILQYTKKHHLPTKVIFLNDGPGLLLGTMWDDYSNLENIAPGKVMVMTLRMFNERLTAKWLTKK